MSEQLPSESEGKIIVFGAKQIRREWVDEEWLFSVVDIIGALTDSPNPRDYWYRMKHREKDSSGVELSTFCRQLKLTSADGTQLWQKNVVEPQLGENANQSMGKPNLANR